MVIHRQSVQTEYEIGFMPDNKKRDKYIVHTFYE